MSNLAEYVMPEDEAPSIERLAARVKLCIEATARLGRDRTEDAHVYFIQRADGPVKIGCAVDVFQRMAALQTASPEPLRLIGVIPLGGYSMERYLHQALAQDRLKGEWFAPTELVLDVAYGLGGAR